MVEQPQRTVHLYYGLRNSREHAFKAVLEDIAASHPALRLNIVYSRPGESDVEGRDYQHRGHVDVDLLRRTLPHGRHQSYVCGPPAMMESLVAPPDDLRAPVATALGDACQGDLTPGWGGVTSLQLWQIYGKDP